MVGWCFRLSSETVKKPGWRGQRPHLLGGRGATTGLGRCQPVSENHVPPSSRICLFLAGRLNCMTAHSISRYPVARLEDFPDDIRARVLVTRRCRDRDSRVAILQMTTSLDLQIAESLFHFLSALHCAQCEHSSPYSEFDAPLDSFCLRRTCVGRKSNSVPPARALVGAAGTCRTDAAGRRQSRSLCVPGAEALFMRLSAWTLVVAKLRLCRSDITRAAPRACSGTPNTAR
jgi:hypothetical protein